MSSNAQSWVGPGAKNVPILRISLSLCLWLLLSPSPPRETSLKSGTLWACVPILTVAHHQLPLRLFPGGSPLPVPEEGVVKLPQRGGVFYRPGGQWENKNHFCWVKQGWESPPVLMLLSGTTLRTLPSRTRTCWFRSRILYFWKVTDLTLGPEKTVLEIMNN